MLAKRKKTIKQGDDKILWQVLALLTQLCSLKANSKMKIFSLSPVVNCSGVMTSG